MILTHDDLIDEHLDGPHSGGPPAGLTNVGI
jgi:hypothetical protein